MGDKSAFVGIVTKLIDITGKALSGEWGTDDLDGSGTPVLRTTNFTNIGKVNYDNVVTRNIQKKNISEKLLKKGDIIIEKSGGTDKNPVGRVIYFEGEENKYLFNNFTGLLRIKDKNEWYPKFVFYSMLANYNRGGTRRFENKTTGLHNLKLDDYVKRLEIQKLPYIDQTHICKLLDCVRFQLDNMEKELELLDELVKARFVEMFGDLESNSMNWEKSLLANKLNVIGGYAFRSSEFNECEGIPVLRIGNINSGYFKPVNMVYWKENPRLSKYEVYPGDLVMSLTGTVGKDDYGNVCILGNEYGMYYLNQRNAKLEIVNGLNKYYLTQLLKFSYIKDKLTGINRGVRQANISNKDILDLVVPVPPLELQNQFASFVEEIDKSRSRIQKSLEASQELFDSLMQEYFG